MRVPGYSRVILYTGQPKKRLYTRNHCNRFVYYCKIYRNFDGWSYSILKSSEYRNSYTQTQEKYHHQNRDNFNSVMIKHIADGIFVSVLNLIFYPFSFCNRLCDYLFFGIYISPLFYSSFFSYILSILSFRMFYELSLSQFSKSHLAANFFLLKSFDLLTMAR